MSKPSGSSPSSNMHRLLRTVAPAKVISVDGITPDVVQCRAQSCQSAMFCGCPIGGSRWGRHAALCTVMASLRAKGVFVSPGTMVEEHAMLLLNIKTSQIIVRFHPKSNHLMHRLRVK